MLNFIHNVFALRNLARSGSRAQASVRIGPPPESAPGSEAVSLAFARRASRRQAVITASSGKTDINKVGLNSIEDPTVKQNLMGRSRFMDKKGWVDSQGRKGKVRTGARGALAVPSQKWSRAPDLLRTRLTAPNCRFRPQGYGVYRFQDKYGANVDGYSPIFTPDQWSSTGGEYKLGTKGLIAWCAAWHV